jgi:hypothetical protein
MVATLGTNLSGSRASAVDAILGALAQSVRFDVD